MRKNETSIKELLSKFNEIWVLEVNEQDFRKNAQLSDLAYKVLAMKLKDEFLLSDLTEEEQEICRKAMIIAQVR